MNYAYKLNDFVFSVSKCERILGVLIDDNLNFCNHVYACVKKAHNICNRILSNVYDMILSSELNKL